MILVTGGFCDLGLSLSISAEPGDHRLTSTRARVALAMNCATGGYCEYGSGSVASQDSGRGSLI